MSGNDSREWIFSALGIDASAAGQSGWVNVRCPACPEGSSPSLKVNVNTLSYKCYRCGASSVLGTKLIDFLEEPVAPSLAARPMAPGGKAEVPPLTVDLVDRYHRLLVDSPTIVQDVERKRGWTIETIKRIDIGWDGTHLMIPIRSLKGDLVNARLYDPFKRSLVKSYHYVNSDGMKRTFPWVPFGESSIKEHKNVWLFEGEPDCILAAQMGFPAVVITGGAGAWSDELMAIIEDRGVVECYDMDVAGRRGAVQVKSRLEARNRKVLNLAIPFLDTKNKDFSDAVLKESRQAGFFTALAKAGWEGDRAAVAGGADLPPPSVVKLGEGVPGEPIALKAHVLGTNTVPVLTPAMLQATCRMGWGDACNTCPLNRAQGSLRVEIQPDSKQMMLLAASSARMQEQDFRRIAGVPTRCPIVAFAPVTFWQVQHLRLVPPMSERHGGDSTIRAAMFVAPADGRPMSVRANQLYQFHGKIEPDVDTNEWTLVSNDARPAEDDVESFTLDDRIAEALTEAFAPEEWTTESVKRSIDAETRSLSRHVTRIYGREDLLTAIDLCYHSVVKFPYRGRTPVRGWVSLGIFGDARTGKSETASTFSQYIGFGKYIMDPANTTYAGLVGGLQQVGSGDKAWTITWGLIPTNDRGLVVIDEISSLSVDDIGKMSGMRSSGIAELTKIRNSSTPARTRLIMAGNPRGVGRTLGSFGTPVEGFMELIGAPEDVARFDLVIGVKAGLNKEAADSALGRQPPPAPLELRRALLMFAWSRGGHQVDWEPGAEELCTDLANRMIEDYDNLVPIVEPSEQDIKIARMAVAVAVRTFSVKPDDYNTVLVRKCHVECAVWFMRACFDGELGYGAFSEYKRRAKLDRQQVVKIVLTATPAEPRAICRALLSLRRVHQNSLGLALGMEGADARLLIARLAQAGAARFEDDRSAHMVWSSEFIVMLREMEQNPPHVEKHGLTDQF